MIEAIINFDKLAMMFLQENVRCAFLDPIMVFFSRIGDAGALWLITGAIMMLSKKHRRAGLYVILSVSLCYVLNDLIIKPLVSRARPFAALDGLSILVPEPGVHSFPSGHSCSSFAAAFVFAKFYGKKGALVYIVSALIAFSRAYVGVHYPSDIIMGIIVGTVGTALLFKFLYPVIDRKIEGRRVRESQK